jgi:hypothetical protein
MVGSSVHEMIGDLYSKVQALTAAGVPSLTAIVSDIEDLRTRIVKLEADVGPAPAAPAPADPVASPPPPAPASAEPA